MRFCSIVAFSLSYENFTGLYSLWARTLSIASSLIPIFKSSTLCSEQIVRKVARNPWLVALPLYLSLPPKFLIALLILSLCKCPAIVLAGNTKALLPLNKNYSFSTFRA